jgi:ABC-type polysaccharide/polyol phosphate export permease
VQLPGKHFFKNLIERRALLYQLIRRDFERRFVGSAGGWLWTLIHPLVLLASWTFVFHVCLQIAVPEGEGTQNYTLFLFCGYLPWMLFQDTVARSTTSLLEAPNLITKTVFPSEMIPVSVFFSSLISHVLALIAGVAVVAIWGGGIGPGLLWLPLYMFLLALLGVGIGWIAAAFQVYLRDTAQAVLVLLTLWFWATPVFLTENQVPERFRWILRSNPLSAFVKAYRDLILSVDLPNWGELAYAAALCVAVFLAGGLVFRQLKQGFADVL